MTRFAHSKTGRLYKLLLRRFGLPADNAPDDTETPAFQSYGQRVRVLNLINMRLVLIAGAGLIALVLLGVGVWALLPEAEPEYRVVPNPHVFLAPTSDPLGSVPASIPQILEQVSITIPARVDQAMTVGGSRLYAFNAESGVSWRVRVSGDGIFSPSVSLYGPDGSLIDSTVGQLQTEFALSVATTGVYTVVIEDVLGTGGTYTLQVLPIL